MILDVQAKDLRPGDFLLGSKRKVLWCGDTAARRGGYVIVLLDDGRGEREWRRSTKMRIDRPDAAEPVPLY